MTGKPTVSGVADGLAKLIREVRYLQAEVAKLTEQINRFTGNRRQFRQARPILPPEVDGVREAKADTDEPKSAIQLIMYEYGANPNLEVPTRTMMAISKELDGALRDVRAARLDLKIIAEDADLRDEFREWQKNQQ